MAMALVLLLRRCYQSRSSGSAKTLHGMGLAPHPAAVRAGWLLSCCARGKGGRRAPVHGSVHRAYHSVPGSPRPRRPGYGVVDVGLLPETERLTMKGRWLTRAALAGALTLAWLVPAAQTQP